MKKTSYKNNKRPLKKQKNIKQKLEKKPGDIEGIYSQTNKDFGFVDVEGISKGYYVHAKNAFQAMSGDTVIAELKEFRGKQEAVIKGIVKRREDPIVGSYQSQGKFGFVIPNESSFKKDIFIPGKKSKNAKDQDQVAVKVISWEGKSPEGEIIQVLGKKGQRGVDIMGIALENGARLDFGGAVLKQLKGLDANITKRDRAVRKDLTHQFTITIDGANSKDLDDAISIESLQNGGYKLSVHIADVAHYVWEDHPIDKEARRRGTSIYLVDQVIPMLPPELSNGLCSLNPNEEKLTLTCDIILNSAGHIKKTEVYESIIRSDFRMTYKEVDEILGGKMGIGDTTLFGATISNDLKNTLESCEKLRQILSKYKKELGVLEFDFPEAHIVMDDQGNPTDFKKYERYNSHKIIEEFMIVANEAISKKFSNLPFLYRVHDEPNEEDVEKLFQTLAVFSYQVPQLSKIQPKDYQKILDQIKQDSKEKLLSKMVLRSLSKAQYSTESDGHFGLALDFYSHFTSPIRRYPDLMIHRIIKESLHKRLDKTRLNALKVKLPGIAQKSSQSEIKAEKLEYKIRDLMACKFMKSKIGQSFEAVVSGVIGKGVFVELENTIEGFLELTGDFYAQHWSFDSDMMIIENKLINKKYTIGDPIKVKLKKVDESSQRIDFELDI